MYCTSFLWHRTNIYFDVTKLIIVFNLIFQIQDEEMQSETTFVLLIICNILFMFLCFLPELNL